jgi:hypothetical protein
MVVGNGTYFGISLELARYYEMTTIITAIYEKLSFLTPFQLRLQAVHQTHSKKFNPAVYTSTNTSFPLGTGGLTSFELQEVRRGMY